VGQHLTVSNFVRYRALFAEAEAAAAALHAMPKSPAVLAALAETQRVLQEAAKKVEQATRPPSRVALDSILNAKSKSQATNGSHPGEPSDVAVSEGREGGSANEEGSANRSGGEDEPGLVMIDELEGLSHVAWQGGGHVGAPPKPRVNGHRVKAAEATAERYDPVRLDLRVRDGVKPTQSGGLLDRRVRDPPSVQNESDLSSGLSMPLDTSVELNGEQERANERDADTTAC
jgi:hypothetical protein